MAAINQGGIFFDAGIGMDQWRQNIAEIREDLSQLNQNTQQQTAAMDNSFKNLSVGIAGYFSGAALAGFVEEVINIRGEFQKTEVAFATMLGSAGKAKDLVTQMVDLAAKTPFSLQEVSSGAKQLLAFQIPANEIVDTLTRMGNVAAGLGVPLARLNLVYGQVKAKGKLMGDDLRQFNEAGLPLIAELAKKLGKADSEISKMVSDGKIGFNDVKEVLFNLTNEGGMFFNLMEKQSETLSGKMSNLGDTIDQMFNKIGEGTEGYLASGIDGLNFLVEHYEDVAKVLGTLIITYGAYRTALMLVSVSQSAAIAPTILTSFGTLIKLIRGATSAQVAFNIAGMANPFVAIATVVAALATGIYLYRKEIGELLGITKKLTDAQIYQEQVMTKYNDNFGKGVTDTKAKIQSLIYIIKSEYSSLKQREDAYKNLISIDPSFRGTLDSQFKATLRLGSTFDFLIKNLQRFAMAQAEMSVRVEKLKAQAQAEMNFGISQVKYKEGEEEIKKQAALLKSGKITVKEYAAAVDKINWDDTFKSYKENKTILNSISKETKYINTLEEEKLKNLQKGIQIQEIQLKNGKVQGKTLSENEKARLKANLDTDKKILAEKLGQNLEEVKIPEVVVPPETAKTKKAKKEKIKELAEVYSKDSISDLEQRISLWQNALNRVGNDNVVKVRFKDKFGEERESGQTVNKDVALAEMIKIQSFLDEKRKELTVKSFDEELQENERQWRIRYEIAKKYGEEVAKAQFPTLKGDSYYDDLNEKFKPLQQKVEVGVSLSDEDLEKYEKLKNILNGLNGVKDPFTNFKESLDDGLQNFKTSSEKIAFLQKKLYNLSGDEISNGQKAEIFNRIDAEQKAQQQLYKEFISQHEDYEKIRTGITAKYDELRKENERKFSKKEITEEEYANVKIKIDSGSDFEMNELSNSIIESSKAWDRAFVDLAQETGKNLKIIEKNLVAFRAANIKNLSTSDLKKVDDKIKEIQQAQSKNPFTQIITSYKNYKNAIKEVQIAQEALDNARGKSNPQEIANKEQQVTDALIKQAQQRQKLAADIQKAQDIFNAIGNGVMEIADIFGGFDAATNDAINNIMAVGNAALDLGKSIAAEDAAGMIKAGIQLIGSVFKAINGDQKKERNIKRWEQSVNLLKAAYENLQVAVQNALGEDVYKDQQKIIANLREQQALLVKMRQEEQDKKKTDDSKVNDYSNQINSIDNQINDIYNNIQESISQTNAKDLSSKLADALIEAYSKGEDAAIAYGKVADDVMQNAVKNALKMQLLEKPMQDMIKQLIKNMGFNEDGTGTFNGLAPEEEAQLKAMMAQASQNYMDALGSYTDIFGQSATDAESLKGSVKGVTEQTAGLLEAQINAMRINQVEILKLKQLSYQIDQKALILLGQIEFNTRSLIPMQKDIAEMNSKMKKNLVGFP